MDGFFFASSHEVDPGYYAGILLCGLFGGLWCFCRPKTATKILPAVWMRPKKLKLRFCWRLELEIGMTTWLLVFLWLSQKEGPRQPYSMVFYVGSCHPCEHGSGMHNLLLRLLSGFQPMLRTIAGAPEMLDDWDFFTCRKWDFHTMITYSLVLCAISSLVNIGSFIRYCMSLHFALPCQRQQSASVCSSLQLETASCPPSCSWGTCAQWGRIGWGLEWLWVQRADWPCLKIRGSKFSRCPTCVLLKFLSFDTSSWQFPLNHNKLKYFHFQFVKIWIVWGALFFPKTSCSVFSSKELYDKNDHVNPKGYDELPRFSGLDHCAFPSGGLGRENGYETRKSLWMMWHCDIDIIKLFSFVSLLFFSVVLNPPISRDSQIVFTLLGAGAWGSILGTMFEDWQSRTWIYKSKLQVSISVHAKSRSLSRITRNVHKSMIFTTNMESPPEITNQNWKSKPFENGGRCTVHLLEGGTVKLYLWISPSLSLSVSFPLSLSLYSVYIYIYIYIYTQSNLGLWILTPPKKGWLCRSMGGRLGLYCHLPCWTGLLSQERQRWMDETYFFVGKCSEWPFFPKFLWFNSSKNVQHQWGGIIPVGRWWLDEMASKQEKEWKNTFKFRRTTSFKTSSSSHYLIGSFLTIMPISDFALLLPCRPMAYEYVRGLGDFWRKRNRSVVSTVLPLIFECVFHSPRFCGKFLGEFMGLRLTSTATVIQACWSCIALCAWLWVVLGGFPQEYDSVIDPICLTLVSRSAARWLPHCRFLTSFGCWDEVLKRAKHYNQVGQAGQLYPSRTYTFCQFSRKI